MSANFYSHVRSVMLPVALTVSASTPFVANAAQVTPIIEHQTNSVTTALDDVLAIFGAEEDYDETAGMDSSYIPAVYYTPEQGLGIGLLYVGLYGSSYGGTTQPSSLIVNPYLSENGSKGITIENRHFTAQDKYRAYLDLSLYQDTGAYYGVGFRAGQDQSNRLNYAERTFFVEPTWLTKLADNYFVGVGLNYNTTRADDFELEDEQGNLQIAQDLQENASWGGALSSVYDSRDNVSNASQGVLLDLKAGYYHSSLTDDWFGEYRLEYSQYQALGDFPGLLAWQVQGDFTSGDVPWNRLPDLGGDDAMRGYLKGRYRDNQMAMAQLEYRVPLYWRVGMVFWGGAGSVAPEVSSLTDNLLTTYGAGLRFKIKDKVNVRADIGVGEDETSFYFHVNEVF